MSNERTNQPSCGRCRALDLVIAEKDLEIQSLKDKLSLTATITEDLVEAKSKLSLAIEGLDNIKHLDKTEYDYNGKVARNRFDEKPGIGKCFKTPRQIAEGLLKTLKGEA